MDEILIAVLRAFAEGARGPLVHELIDKLEAGHAAPATETTEVTP